MRILYLCKRQYMGHDVIADRYARLYEQPYQLAELGNDVLGVCLSYRVCIKKDEVHKTNNGSLRWLGFSPGQSRIGIFNYLNKSITVAKEFRPDIVVGSSDCLHVVLGQRIAQKLNVKYAADLYDDYETFGLAKFPFVKTLYRKALTRTQAISCVSEKLAEYIKNIYAKNAIVISLPSTVNHSIFYPRPQKETRRLFHLPENAFIVGTAGGLTKDKGIKTVYEAFRVIANINPSIHFVLAGTLDKKCPMPIHEKIHYLGKLSHEKIAELFCTLNVGIVYLRNTSYGQPSFPQKAYEMAACKIPMVVAKVGDMGKLFSKKHNELYEPDDMNSLVNAILNQIKKPHYPTLQIVDWTDQARELQSLYLGIIQCKRE